MVEKYKNTYRISSARLKKWDYCWNAAYFVTICTKNKHPYFGQIIAGKMELSTIGVIADILLYETKNHLKEIELTEFVIMPNHVHAILIINNPPVETLHATSQSNTEPRIKSPKNNLMASRSPIIRSYKSAVTKHAHRLGYNFVWQSRFHDHIIRNNESFQKIQTYIVENPLKWEQDKFYSSVSE